MGSSEHSVALRCGWSVWRWGHLRATGFPAELVLRLAASRTAMLLDEIATLEREESAARRRAIEIGTKATEIAPKGVGKAIGALVSALVRGRLPEASSDDPTVAAALRDVTDAVDRLAKHRRRCEATFAEEQAAIADALRATAADPALREAVVWQNRAAFEDGLEQLVAAPPEQPSNKALVKRRQLVASYLQRYCLKNDTIGFFGPLGFLRVDDEPGHADFRPGPSLLASRAVFIERWACALLADALGREPELREHLVPLRSPALRVEPDVIYARGHRLGLPAEFARVLAGCDGTRSAAALAEELLEDDELGLGDGDQVLQMLEQLAERGLLSWSFALAGDGRAMLAGLRAALAALPASGARDRASAALASFDEAVAKVAAAAGDVPRLVPAIRALEERFRTITQQEAHRRGGEAYAGRTIFYEDCVRDAECRLGRDFLDRIAPATTLVLQSARWYTYEIGRAYEAMARRAYDERRGERIAIDLDELLDALAPVLAPGAEPTARIAAALMRHWQEILGVTEGGPSVDRSSSAIHAAVSRVFAAPHPGWPGARHHNPDFLLAAKDAAALQRGEYLCILGEIHVATNTLLVPASLVVCPFADEILRAHGEDVTEPGLAPVPYFDDQSRVVLFPAPNDVDLELGPGSRSTKPRERVAGIGEMIVAAVGDELRVRTRDGRIDLPLMAYLQWHLRPLALKAFDLLPPMRHRARVSIDGVVVARERWVLPAGEAGFGDVDGALARFGAARRWAKTHGLPRFVFVSVPEEPRPFFVDFESPLYVDLLARQLRRSSTVSVTEMLPMPDEAWLSDARGATYTSELRILAVDPEPWRPMRGVATVTE